MLFPRYLYNIRFLSQLKPIYDAFWNPFKVNYRFYLGLRAILRFVPFFLSLYVHSPVNVFIFVLFIVGVWCAQERIQPYEGYWRNAIDSFFLTNLLLLFVVNLFFMLPQVSGQVIAYKVLIYLLLLSSYVMVGVIFIVHLFLRFPKLKQKLIKIWKILTSKSSERQKNEICSMDTMQLNSDMIDDDHSGKTGILKKPVTYSVLREPLLEDSYGSISSSDVNDSAHV